MQARPMHSFVKEYENFIDNDFRFHNAANVKELPFVSF
jgi:hypothetical protein